MKKTAAAILVVIICLINAVFAQEAEWYELSAENSVLTVWLPVDTDDGRKWEFSISDPEHIELLTHEVTEEERPVYAASFANFSGGTADVTVTFAYAAEGEYVPLRANVIRLNVEGGILSVESVRMCERRSLNAVYDEEAGCIEISLPNEGYQWTVYMSEPGHIEAGNFSEEDDVFVTRFFGSAESPGSTELTLENSAGIVYTLCLYADETGAITVRWADENIIIE